MTAKEMKFRKSVEHASAIPIFPVVTHYSEAASIGILNPILFPLSLFYTDPLEKHLK